MVNFKWSFPYQIRGNFSSKKRRLGEILREETHSQTPFNDAVHKFNWIFNNKKKKKKEKRRRGKSQNKTNWRRATKQLELVTHVTCSQLHFFCPLPWAIVRNLAFTSQ